jgi:hypothetical protein
MFKYTCNICHNVQAQAQYVIQNATAAPSLSSAYPTLETSAPSYPPNLNTSPSPYPTLTGSSSPHPTPDSSAPSYPSISGSPYPELAEYMGMELSRDVIAANMPEYLPENQVSLKLIL